MYSCIPSLQRFLILFAVLKLNLQIEGAHPARRQTRSSYSYSTQNTKYDRSITTFSQDGRLLQVEYGMEASNKGQAVACLEFDYEHEKSKKKKKNDLSFSVICIALVTQEKEDGEILSSNQSNDKDTKYVDNDSMKNLDQNTESSSPSRQATTSENTVTMVSSEKVHRIDDHCLLVTTGLIGDGRVLAQSARMACQRMRLMYGETPTIAEIANDVARTQHQLTRTSGTRPFGVTATLVGIDPFLEKDTYLNDLFVPSKDSAISENNIDEKDEKSKNEAMSEINQESMKNNSINKQNKPDINEEEFISALEDESSDDNDLDDETLGKLRLFQSEPGGIVEEYYACAAGKHRNKMEINLMQLRQSLYERACSFAKNARDHNNESVKGLPELSLKQEHDVDQIENKTESFQTKLMGEVVSRFGKTVFETDANAERLDIWIMESNTKHRGGVRIRCAKNVAFNDLEKIKDILKNSC